MFPLIAASKMVLLSSCYLEATIVWLTLNNNRVLEISQARKRDESARTYKLLIINLRQREHRWKHCSTHDFLRTSDRSTEAMWGHWGSGERCRCPRATKIWEKGTVTRILPEFSEGCYMSSSTGSHFYYVKLRK